MVYGPAMNAGYVLSDKFTGKERDSETGLDNFLTRYFSSAQGRFTSPDAPFNDQDPSDPQSWHLKSRECAPRFPVTSRVRPASPSLAAATIPRPAGNRPRRIAFPLRESNT
jgi:RHS repeat-associated protein